MRSKENRGDRSSVHIGTAFVDLRVVDLTVGLRGHQEHRVAHGEAEHCGDEQASVEGHDDEHDVVRQEHDNEVDDHDEETGAQALGVGLAGLPILNSLLHVLLEFLGNLVPLIVEHFDQEADQEGTNQGQRVSAPRLGGPFLKDEVDLGGLVEVHVHLHHHHVLGSHAHEVTFARNH
uniref:Uncharacterized protein n=1 Tax=Strombidium inclinatum TaxID=197538 RepID=A0A7S3N2A4_9SPIT